MNDDDKSGDEFAFVTSKVTLAEDNDMTFSVIVGGIDIPMIVDSGASCNVISRSEWENLNGINAIHLRKIKLNFTHMDNQNHCQLQGSSQLTL